MISGCPVGSPSTPLHTNKSKTGYWFAMARLFSRDVFATSTLKSHASSSNDWMAACIAGAIASVVTSLMPSSDLKYSSPKTMVSPIFFPPCSMTLYLLVKSGSKTLTLQVTKSSFAIPELVMACSRSIVGSFRSLGPSPTAA